MSEVRKKHIDLTPVKSWKYQKPYDASTKLHKLDNRLSSKDKEFLNVLMLFDTYNKSSEYGEPGRVAVSEKQIADIINCHVQTVKKCVRKCRHLGYIITHERIGRVSEYYLTELTIDSVEKLHRWFNYGSCWIHIDNLGNNSEKQKKIFKQYFKLFEKVKNENRNLSFKELRDLTYKRWQKKNLKKTSKSRILGYTTTN